MQTVFEYFYLSTKDFDVEILFFRVFSLSSKENINK